MTTKLRFTAIQARQSTRNKVFSFAANAEEIFQIAKIERAGRTQQGDLFGFQRPQVSGHILEIRDYLKKEESVLPNSVVLAFVGDFEIIEKSDGICEVVVDISNGAPGLIVDGQQRLTALQPLTERNFQVFVSAILCENDDELRRQFILINNTRPLPKELIYELLPTVGGLPHRLSSRSFAAHITTKLNYFDEGNASNSALFGNIKQHTNPGGSISSTAVQKVVMNSRSNGALRELAGKDDIEERSVHLIGNFYGALMDLFPDAWIGRSPRNSRLKHSAGIIAAGFAMEVAYGMHGARTRSEFKNVLECLKHERACAWTSGRWYFSDTDVREWDKVQNTAPDVRILTNHLVRIVKDQGVKTIFEAPENFNKQIMSI